jgi:thiol-disulfide isomerase/thioredoxin
MSKIQRIDKKSVIKILDGAIEGPHSVVIKFYAPHCSLCHNLSSYYKDIAESYDDVLFFAFNMEDDEGQDLERKYGFSGIPTFFHIKASGTNTKVTLMPEPDNPNEHTWYRVEDIKKFINKHK